MNIQDLAQRLRDVFPARKSGVQMADMPPVSLTLRDTDRNFRESFETAVGKLHGMMRRSVWRRSEPTAAERLFCGLALLGGTNFTLKRLIAAIPGGAATFGPQEIVIAMGNLGFCTGRLKKTLAQVPDKRLPALIVTSNKDAYVLFLFEGQRLLLSGNGRVRGLDILENVHGDIEIWSFGLDRRLFPLSQARRSHTGHTWLRALLVKFGGIGGSLVLLSMVLAMAGVMMPLFTIQIYGQVIGLGSLEPLPYLVGGMGLVVALEIALLMYRSNILAWVSSRLDYLTSIASFERMLKIRPALSERAVVTDQASRLRTFESVRNFLTGPMFAAMLDVPGTLISVIFIGIIGGWLALVPVLGILAHLSLYGVLLRRARIMTSVAADESTEMQRMAIETFEKREAIRQAGLHHLWVERLVRAARREQKTQFLLRMIGALGESGSIFIFTVTVMMLLAFGAMGAWDGRLGAGGLLAVIILGFRALAPFHMLCMSIQRIEQLRNSIRQINTLMDIPMEREEKRDYSSLRHISGSLSFLNTGFRVADTRPVFVGLEMEVEPGQVIGITGSNGSGKSSLLKLVLGMVDLSLGAIRIDGIDTRQLNYDEVRSRISYVPQYPKLFSGTLRDNLMFADPLADDAKIAKALKIVGLAPKIAALPNRLDHQVEDWEEGIATTDFLFRFALAQALLVESKLILIDEIPNALLDGDVGQLMKSLITNARGNRTLLFVSHRSDFLSLADRVVALRYGKIPIVKSPQALLERAA